VGSITGDGTLVLNHPALVRGSGILGEMRYLTELKITAQLCSMSEETGRYCGTRKVTPEVLAAALTLYYQKEELDERIEVESLEVNLSKLPIYNNNPNA
jgi:hypothetical protein